MMKWDRSKEKTLKTSKEIKTAIEDIKGSKVENLFDSRKDRTNALARLRSRLKTALKREEAQRGIGQTVDMDAIKAKVNGKDKENKERKRRSKKKVKEEDQAKIMEGILKELSSLLEEKNSKVLYDEKGLMFPQTNVLSARKSFKVDDETVAGIITQNFSKRFGQEPEWYTTFMSGNSTVIALGPVPDSLDF